MRGKAELSISGAHAAATPRILGCLVDARLRQRVQDALRDHANLEWFDSFEGLRRAVEARGPLCTAVIGTRDGAGDSAASFARTVRAGGTGTAIVVYCDLADEHLQSVADLAIAGVHDVLFAGMSDAGHAARSIIFGACLGGAGDLVMNTMARSLPPALSPFVELAVRRPRELRRVSDVAAALSIPRQTIGRWCRAHRFVGPEELLMWVRLLLVTAMLESTGRTLESIANEMQYGSPPALRNRIREYTGLTATQLRRGGVRRVMETFESRIRARTNAQGLAGSGRQAAAMSR